MRQRGTYQGGVSARQMCFPHVRQQAAKRCLALAMHFVKDDGVKPWNSQEHWHGGQDVSEADTICNGPKVLWLVVLKHLRVAVTVWQGLLNNHLRDSQGAASLRPCTCSGQHQPLSAVAGRRRRSSGPHLGGEEAKMRPAVTGCS